MTIGTVRVYTAFAAMHKHSRSANVRIGRSARNGAWDYFLHDASLGDGIKHLGGARVDVGLRASGDWIASVSGILAILTASAIGVFATLGTITSRISAAVNKSRQTRSDASAVYAAIVLRRMIAVGYIVTSAAVFQRRNATNEVVKRIKFIGASHSAIFNGIQFA